LIVRQARADAGGGAVEWVESAGGAGCAPLSSIEVVRDVGVTRVALVGEIDFDNASQLIDCVRELLAKGDAQLWVDLRRLTFCDARGLAALVRSAARCRRAGGVLTVTGATGSVARVMAITGVDEILRGDGADPGGARGPATDGSSTFV
jgi:anti-sigma B factor antagonist